MRFLTFKLFSAHTSHLVTADSSDAGVRSRRSKHEKTHSPRRSETETDLDSQAIEEAIEARRMAKQSKDFAEADRIRAELTAQGIELIDKPGGITEWRRG